MRRTGRTKAGNAATNGPAATLQEIVRSAEQDGYAEAIRRYPDARAPRRTEYPLQVASRELLGDFRLLLPLSQEATVLQVGIDWGAASVSLARSSRRVYAVDLQAETLRFTALRAQQEGLENVVLLNGSVLRLPLDANSCDAAVLLDVLEWVPTHVDRALPDALQLEALGEVYRILKPGGCLYLSVENRYGYNYLLGARDLHTGLRFVSILPRRLADVYSRLARKRPYREWTLSLRDLEKRLSDVRFRAVEVFCVLPGYRDFSYIVPARRPEALRFALKMLETHTGFRAWHSLALRLPLPGGGLAALAPRYAWLARK